MGLETPIARMGWPVARMRSMVPAPTPSSSSFLRATAAGGGGRLEPGEGPPGVAHDFMVSSSCCAWSTSGL
jgi:hypothetical protein